MALKETPLVHQHISLGAKMVEFGGWNMPLQYQGLRQEHLNVRENVGLFDVSHMGQLRFKGSHALQSLEWLTTNKVEKLKTLQAQYTLLPNEQGGLVDDLIVYCLKPGEDYLLCVNAANKDKDFDWVVKNNRYDAEIVDESSQWALIAVQGPKATQLVQETFGIQVSEVGFFHCAWADWEGESCLLARTGYTGEDGFEAFVPAGSAKTVWQALMRKGENLGVAPAGLGARDSLRTEACLPLYGHEIDAHTNPYAAKLGWAVKPKSKDFLGKSTILEQKEEK